LSCSPHRYASFSPDTVRRLGKSLLVKAILTTSGERIEFSRGIPAQIGEQRIVWSGSGPHSPGAHDPRPTVRIAEDDFERMPGPEGTMLDRVRTKSGVVLSGDVGRRKDGSITLRLSGLDVPVSLVDQVLIQETDGTKTFLIVLGVAALAFVAVVAIVLATKESCPFVYSYDGDTYVLDGEPYGGATSPGLQRTDWGRLEHLKEGEGEYRFKVTNEVDETQYTDELKLVVVDHPRGVSVVADESGALRSASAPVPPSKAVDTHGRNILSYVSDDDWVSWRSEERDLDPATLSGTKERLTFEFPKPAGAKRAKLVFDGGNTLWGSQMVKGFLALRGRELGSYYASLERPGPAMIGLLAWNLREELYRMNIRVFTTSGWVSKGSMAGGGPFVTRAKVYSLDVADVPGDVLRIELTPAVGFWTVNHLAIDYTDDVAFTAREIAAVRAVDASGSDIVPLLASTDRRYFAMPNTGDSADVVFKAPRPEAGLERTIILKTNGYYDIHMGNLGDPQPDILARVRSEPGFAVRYALGQYQQWKADQQAGTVR